MRFSRQEHLSGLPGPPPGGLPDPGIEPGSPALQADSLPLSHRGAQGTGHWKSSPGSCSGEASRKASEGDTAGVSSDRRHPGQGLQLHPTPHTCCDTRGKRNSWRLNFPSHKIDLLVVIIVQTVVRISLKNDTNELIYKTETDSQTSQTCLQLPKGKRGLQGDEQFGINIHTQLYAK